MPQRLSHDETLRWIAEHRAWRLVRKTKPIWARPVEAEESGKEFLTADHVWERAHPDYWVCVGIVGEPWFQMKDRIEAKYARTGQEQRAFSFDTTPRTYWVFTPRDSARNWAARIEGPGIEGFVIQPNYAANVPLYSPAGGYVVRDYVDDPYQGDPNDVWLVQQSVFESTYEQVT